MSRKKQLKKENIPVTLHTSAVPQATTQDYQRLKFVLAIIITALALLLYIQTSSFRFALDDGPTIAQNKLVQKGFDGLAQILTTDYWYGYSDALRGLQYRPASLVMFAIEEEFFPGNPQVHHIVNVLLYALTCGLLFVLLAKIFKKENLLLPFITALLFAAHPIHTEVVSNIKSRDEILCFLFGLGAVFAFLHYCTRRNPLLLVIGGLSFFLAFTAKETAIAFVFVVPLVLYYAGESGLKNFWPVILSLIFFSALYFFIRHQVVKDVTGIDLLVIDNTLVAAANNSEKYGTAFSILLRYLGLLIIPHPLSYDYSFAQIEIVSLGSMKALFGLIVYMALGIFAMLKIAKRNPYAFAVLLFLFLLAPVSNIFLQIGSTMAERFLYMPSLGFCLVIGLLIKKLVSSSQQTITRTGKFFTIHAFPLLVVAMLVSIYSFKTISRNKAWEDNVSLFAKDVATSPNSARARYNYGMSNVYDLYLKETDPGLKQSYLEEGKRQLDSALLIYPDYLEARKPLGFVHLKQGNFQPALEHFDVYLAANPSDEVALNHKAAALMGLQQYQKAIPILQTVLRKTPGDTSAVKNIGRCYAYSSDFEKAAQYFLQSIELSPGVAENYRLAGMAYQFMGDSARARPLLEKANSIAQ